MTKKIKKWPQIIFKKSIPNNLSHLGISEIIFYPKDSILFLDIYFYTLYN